VALECGYDSLGTFVSTFKKAVGMRPSEFRAFLVDLGALTLSIPLSFSPSSLPKSSPFWLNISVGAQCGFKGLAFIAICNAFDGSVLNCGALPLDGLASARFAMRSAGPHIVLAAAYSANVPFHLSLVDDPPLLARIKLIPEF